MSSSIFKHIFLFTVVIALAYGRWPEYRRRFQEEIETENAMDIKSDESPEDQDTQEVQALIVEVPLEKEAVREKFVKYQLPLRGIQVHENSDEDEVPQVEVEDENEVPKYEFRQVDEVPSGIVLNPFDMPQRTAEQSSESNENEDAPQGDDPNISLVPQEVNVEVDDGMPQNDDGYIANNDAGFEEVEGRVVNDQPMSDEDDDNNNDD